MLTREMYDIAQRVGQRRWVQQAIGVGASSSFDAGHWDEWIPEMVDEEPMAAEFYRHWFRSERAIRMAYRGHVADAIPILEEALASTAVLSSVQATVGIRVSLAAIRMLEGRWAEAFEGTREGWGLTEAAAGSIGLAMLAAVAGGDRERLREAVAAADGLEDQQPISVAVRQMGEVCLALLDGRWSDARTGYSAATLTLEATYYRRVLASFRMAVGHIASDRFPEAVEALRDAESFFAERGADTVVADYRTRAATAPATSSTGHSSRCLADARRRRRLRFGSTDDCLANPINTHHQAIVSDAFDVRGLDSCLPKRPSAGGLTNRSCQNREPRLAIILVGRRCRARTLKHARRFRGRTYAGSP